MRYKLGGISLSSSVDPAKLSTTVSGVIVSLSAILIFVAGKFGIMLGAEQISLLAVQIGGAVGALATLYGIIRKIVVIVSDTQK